MTTIAVDADLGIMAADTQVTDYNLITRMQKIYILPDGSLVGMTGECAKGWRAIKWILDGRKGKKPKFRETQLVFLRPDKTIWVAEEHFPEYPLLSRQYGAGSGGQLAIMAMSKGDDPATAVKSTVKFDSYTSDPVQVLSLDDAAKEIKNRG